MRNAGRSDQTSLRAVLAAAVFERCSAPAVLKIEAATEALRNVTTPTWAFDTSLKVSLPFIALVAEYSYVPSTFGLLGELSNDFFALGHLGMLAMKGPIGDGLGLDWFTKSYVSENELRLVAGIGLSWVYTPEQ